VNDDDVEALSPLTALMSLSLACCLMVRDEGLRALAPLTALTSLNLTSCHMVSDKGVRVLSRLLLSPASAWPAAPW
jgi:hypothetical protein